VKRRKSIGCQIKCFFSGLFRRNKNSRQPEFRSVSRLYRTRSDPSFSIADSAPLSPLQPPGNHIRVKRSTPIRGEWLIDPSIVVPPALLVPLKNPKEKRHNLHLWSATSSIDACARVLKPSNANEGIGSEPSSSSLKEREPVMLTASTQAQLTFRIIRESNQPISVFCRGSSIRVYLPRSFEGTVRAETSGGGVRYSDEVAKKFVTVYERDGTTRHYIGDLCASKPGREQQKGCDRLKVIARSRDGRKKGTVYICYSDE